MKLWIKIIAGVIPGAASFLIALFLLRWRRRRWRQRQQQLISPQTPSQILNTDLRFKFDNLQVGRLHQSYKSGSSARSSLRFHYLNSQHHTPAMPPPSPFNWDEHPRLITEAVEFGWPRFAFSASTPRVSSGPLMSEGDWDIPPGSSEFMQTVRINPGPKKGTDDSTFSTARCVLPLPGPALGGGSFPQEAYYEITILLLQQRKKLQQTVSKQARNVESDRAKLIRGNSMGDAIAVEFTSHESIPSAEEGRSGNFSVVLGLSNRVSSLGHSLPGNFPGSIGFRSDGSVQLDGRKLVFESEKAGWAAANRVIGCGFEPSKKKVFFTVDSQLAHVIRCSSEAYSSPLYPILAAFSDVMIFVNLGQEPFKYAPANATRTQNPCFLRLTSGDLPPAGSVDSHELFSVSRMEAEWLEHGQSNNYDSSSKKSNGNFDDGIDAESDLFEIALHR